ncbi:MAG: leucine-rich repeat domain-containing protein [Muribaculaceae bacterium]|nr:leucine-rich repeat domain-containing protein [Muribaculaceae bacterium]
MKKRFLLSLSAVFLLSFSPQVAARDFQFSYGGTNITYTVISEKDRTCSVKENNSVGGHLTLPAKPLDGDIEYSLVSIGGEAFSECKGLTGITIPDGVSVIGEYAFYDCARLESIALPESIDSIGTKAFSDCFNLKKAEFASLESLCRIKFAGDYSNPLQRSIPLVIDGEEVTEITFPENMNEVMDYTFAGGSQLTSIKLHDGITSIGKNSFYYCSGITSLEIPADVVSIGEKAFYYCTGLTSLNIPAGVKEFHDYCFSSCNGLTSISIPDGLTAIGTGAFHGCSGLTSISLPESLKTIGEYAFSSCNGFTDITFPEGVVEIGPSAFSWCNNLASIDIAGSVESIGESAFYGCDKLTNIVIPEGVRTIGEQAFRGCSGVTSLSLPNTLTTIGKLAFDWCDNLEEVRVNAIVPPVCDNIYSSYTVFDYTIYHNTTLYVPEESLEEYKGVSPWSEFKKIEVMESSSVDAITDGCGNPINFTEPHEVYDFSGKKIGVSKANLPKGCYIIRQGKKMSKLIVR